MRTRAWLLTLAVAAAAAGCADRRVGKVSGVATLDDRPLAGAEVTLWPKEDTQIQSYTALTGPDGRFEFFRDPRPEAGLRCARYVALVAKWSGAGAATREGMALPPGEEGVLPGTRNILPPLYRDRERCPFVVELKPGDNELKLELKGKP